MIDSSNHQKCTELIEDGDFIDFAEIVGYSLRFFRDYIEHHDVKSISKINREFVTGKSVRINERVMEDLMKTGFFKKSEIVDYSLDFYFKYRENSKRRLQ